VCQWFGATKPPAHLKMGTQFIPEKWEKLHILTRLSARNITLNLNFFNPLYGIGKLYHTSVFLPFY
jgi:hypothetical protein